MKSENAHRVVSASGEIDAFTAPALQQALDEALSDGEGAVIADLTDVTFVDSAGLGVLVLANRELQLMRRLFVVATAAKEVRRVLAISALDRVLLVVDDLEQALVRASVR